jgi:hypothetical protein
MEGMGMGEWVQWVQWTRMGKWVMRGDIDDVVKGGFASVLLVLSCRGPSIGMALWLHDPLAAWLHGCISFVSFFTPFSQHFQYFLHFLHTLLHFFTSLRKRLWAFAGCPCCQRLFMTTALHHCPSAAVVHFHDRTLCPHHK